MIIYILLLYISLYIFYNLFKVYIMAENVTKEKISFFARFRRYFLAGILVTSPILITAYVTWMIITFIDNQVAGILPESLDFTKKLPHQIPGLGLIISIIAITFIGALTPGFIGRTLLKTGERVLDKMPVIRSIYGAIKQIMETVMSTNSESFREVVLVEYPRKGIWVIGFVTGETKGEVQTLNKEKLINVFIPTTPNPTSGFLLFLPKKDLVYMAMKVEDAVKMVISGGIVTPKNNRSLIKKNN